MKARLLSAGALLILLTIALNGYALRISPVQFDLRIAQGAGASLSFSVLNNEEEPLELTIGRCDWLRSVEGENLFCEEAGEVARSATAWLSVTPTRFALRPGEDQDVRFSISTPEASPGGIPLEGTYWTAIMVEVAPQASGGQPEGTEIVIKRRFGLKVLVTFAGTGEKAGQVGDLARHGLNPLWATLAFRNRGSLNLSNVSGRVEIRDASGRTLETLPIAPFPVLPGATRHLVVESRRPKGERYPPGKYLALAVLDYGGPHPVGAQLVFEVPELELRPIGDADAPPADRDGDGFYEDVDGDGRLTLEDPARLGFHLDDPAVRENWPAFDFDNDGSLDFDDVIALKERVDAQE